jgi:hypothetical protein
MGRPSWPLIVLLALLGSWVAFGIALVVWPEHDEVHSSGPRLHPPESAEELEAAGTGIVYLRALQRRDVAAACDLAEGEVARLLRCSGEARVPGELRPAGRLKAVDASVHGETAGLGISGGRGCVNFLALRRTGGAWRVTEHSCGGYA